MRFNKPSHSPGIALALGGGAARGWAHIGVFRALIEANIFPNMIAGTSIGAVVGGCYAAGKLDELEEFATSLTRRRLLSLLDIRLDGSGLIGGNRVEKLLSTHLKDTRIEDLDIDFVTVSSDLYSGHEVWFTEGELVPAMIASYSLPGVFKPFNKDGRWLVDGALANPVPVSVCRAYGQDFVIGVQVDADKPLSCEKLAEGPGPQDRRRQDIRVEGAERRHTTSQEKANLRTRTSTPSALSTLLSSFNFIQERVGRSRLAGDPPDMHIRVQIPNISFFDFHRADEVIEHGYNSMKRFIPDIKNFIAFSEMDRSEEKIVLTSGK